MTGVVDWRRPFILDDTLTDVPYPVVAVYEGGDAVGGLKRIQPEREREVSPMRRE
jgi:hypothetical protein